jgi:hypothetical protein
MNIKLNNNINNIFFFINWVYLAWFVLMGAFSHLDLIITNNMLNF